MSRNQPSGRGLGREARHSEPLGQRGTVQLSYGVRVGAGDLAGNGEEINRSGPALCPVRRS